MAKRTTLIEREQIDTFVLQLPPELDAIKPLHIIPLPGKHVGLIFEETIEAGKTNRRGYTAEKEVKGWRYKVQKQDGSPAKNSYPVGDWSGQFYDNLLDLKLAIEFDAHSLTPKTRTRQQRDDYED